MRKPMSWVALLGVLALLVAPTAHAATARPLTTTELGTGVTHEVWPVGGSTARVHLARVAPQSTARLSVVQVAPLASGRETPSAICRRTPGCVVALNGDFFTSDGPVGAVVVNGRMLRSPRADHEQLSLDPLRVTTGGLGRAGWSGQVQAPDAGPLALDGVNVPLPGDGAILYTGAYGAQSPACTCVELVLSDPSGRLGRLGEPAAVKVIGRSAGATALSAGVAVIAASGTAADRLLQVGEQAPRLTVTVRTGQSSRQNLGIHPVLLREGQPVPFDAADPMLSDPHPRAVVAWDGRGTSWLLAFEGRRPGGPGPTAQQVVEFVRGLGASEAVLLDGGGSTSLATAAGPLNSPSDGVERPVSNVVMLTAPVVVQQAARAAVAQVRAPVVPPARPKPAAVVAKPAVTAPKAPVVVVAAPAPVARPVIVAAPRTFSTVGQARAARELAARPLAGRGFVPAPPDPPVPIATALLLLAAAAWAHAAVRVSAAGRPGRRSLDRAA